MAVLFDGDKGGDDRLKRLKDLLENKSIPYNSLSPKDTSIEDHIPLVSELYVRAVAEHVAKVLEDTNQDRVGVEALAERLRKSFKDEYKDATTTTSITKWVNRMVKEIGGFKPSKVGIAREYVQLLTELDSKSRAPNIGSVYPGGGAAVPRRATGGLRWEHSFESRFRRCRSSQGVSEAISG